ncbi:MAG: GNAT family N-acetyltransferase [Verrucomicrobiales bacterium]|nr:GNAT family N-acetyltransferase [Verrucomicrobiales bacterium]
MSDLFKIRPAVPGDCDSIHRLLMELAEYEKITHWVESTPASTHQALFGDQPAAGALVAEVEGIIIGTAVFFHNYSTFIGKQGLYLEDIYITPEQRGKGIGKAILKELARLAVKRNCGRMEWTVLDWNQPAIDFYDKIGGEMLDEWRIVRMNREGIEALAES